MRFDLAGGNDVVPNRTAVPIRADGGDGNDDLRANAGSDRLLGGAGSDLLRGGLGADDLDGGLGWDSVTYPENGHEGVRLVVTIDNIADDGARNLGEIANDSDECPRVERDRRGQLPERHLHQQRTVQHPAGRLGNDNADRWPRRGRRGGRPGDDQLAGNDPFGARSPTERSTR